MLRVIGSRKTKGFRRRYSGTVRVPVNTNSRKLVSGLTSEKNEKGHALVSVLFLITILSLLCAIVLEIQLFRRHQALQAIDDIKALHASNNGIESVIAAGVSLSNEGAAFSLEFPDGSNTNITTFQWGLFAAVTSRGRSNGRTASRSALLARKLSNADEAAFALGNLQHGLVLAGKSRIMGDVLVGPQGVTTGSLRNEVTPSDVPIRGNVRKVNSGDQIVSDSLLDRSFLVIRSLLRGSKRMGSRPDTSGIHHTTGGYIDLANVSDSIVTILCTGNVTLGDTIMRRGPPLFILVKGYLYFRPAACVLGPVALVATDSIVIPPQIKLFNSLVISPRSISLLQGASVTAQIFSPVIRCASNTTLSYPSVIVSVNLSDSVGTPQSIDLKSGASISGAVVMHLGRGVSFESALTELEPGSVVTGGVVTDGYLTLDGTVNGFVRAFDLYFYESPTTYLGWMRGGLIDRKSLPYGFLAPLWISDQDKEAILSWM